MANNNKPDPFINVSMNNSKFIDQIHIKHPTTEPNLCKKEMIAFIQKMYWDEYHQIFVHLIDGYSAYNNNDDVVNAHRNACNQQTEELIYGAIIEAEKKVSLRFRQRKLVNCKIFMNAQLADFAIVQSAAEFYGKPVKDYILDVLSLVNLKKIPNLSPIYNQTITKIVCGIALMMISHALYYIRLSYVVVGTIDRDRISSYVSQTVFIITKHIEKISTETNQDYHTITEYQIATSLAQDNEIMPQYISISKLIMTSVKKYGSKNLTSSSTLKDEILSCPDYHFFGSNYFLFRSFKLNLDKYPELYFMLNYRLNNINKSKIKLMPIIDNISNTNITIEI